MTASEAAPGCPRAPGAAFAPLRPAVHPIHAPRRRRICLAGFLKDEEKPDSTDCSRGSMRRRMGRAYDPSGADHDRQALEAGQPLLDQAITHRLRLASQLGPAGGIPAKSLPLAWAEEYLAMAENERAQKRPFGDHSRRSVFGPGVWRAAATISSWEGLLEEIVMGI